MKHTILAILAAMLLFSCKKDKPAKPDNSGKLYTVNFKVNSFSQVLEPIGKSSADKKLLADGDSLALKINSILYRLYTTNGTLIKQKTSISSAKEFGTLLDSLAAGNYTAVIMGFKGAYTIQEPNTVLPDVNTSLFYKKINFTVSNQNLNQQVALERMNAGLQIILTDEGPISSSVLQYRATVNDYQAFSIFNYTPVTVPNETRIITLKKDKGNFNGGTFDLGTSVSILNTTGPVTVTIWAASNLGGNVIYAQKTLNNVMFYRNKKTILTGKLFSNDPGATGGTGFTTSLKTEFEPDTLKTNY